MWSFVAVRVAQAIGITGGAWLSGNIAIFSMNVIPALLRSREETNLPLNAIAKQWREIYETGKRQNPLVAMATATAFAYLAVSSHSSSPLLRTGLYTSAALLTLGIVPFTVVAMGNTNHSLMRICELGGQNPVGGDARVEGYLQDWVALNMVRSLFPLAASLTAIAAAFL
ncbi:hypothetical protein BJX99DRAFT_255337 [Aspergillus californicus]